MEPDKLQVVKHTSCFNSLEYFCMKSNAVNVHIISRFTLSICAHSEGLYRRNTAS